ncbi:hypothetical protein RA276_27470, partial [Pseudomonas syringae pv. tagetis]|uniref:hypothetical protein n=1 Tax=Pseudomonas syringae group genomosp. 7 TaxID=251699 RepID=UPI00376FE3D9
VLLCFVLFFFWLVWFGVFCCGFGVCWFVFFCFVFWFGLLGCVWVVGGGVCFVVGVVCWCGG